MKKNPSIRPEPPGSAFPDIQHAGVLIHYFREGRHAFMVVHEPIEKGWTVEMVYQFLKGLCPEGDIAFLVRWIPSDEEIQVRIARLGLFSGDPSVVHVLLLEPPGEGR